MPETALAVGTRHFVLDTQKDFEAGELESASVDSLGHLRPGFQLADQEIADVTTAWDAELFEGALYVATGNEGKLVRIKDGKSDVVASANALALTSVTVAFGKLIVGGMGSGKLFTLSADKASSGKSTAESAAESPAESPAENGGLDNLAEFADLAGAGHVWGLAFDESQGALYVATGPEGKIFRVTQDGTAQVYFDAKEAHLVSVAAKKGVVYAGSSDKARLYKLSGAGRAEVLHDFGTTEVRAIEVGPDGSVFVIDNELKGGARQDSVKAETAAGPEHASAKGGSGRLQRFSQDGSSEVLFELKKEHFVSLALTDQGLPLVGTGTEGRVYEVSPGHRSTLVADVEGRQAAAVVLSSKASWLVASDPVRAHRLTETGPSLATWTSKALDAGLRARFGRLDWDGSGKVTVETRSGNTEEPDETWTDWSPELSAPGEVKSAAGRYLQLRVKLHAGAVLRRLDVPFLTDNLRAVVTQVSAKSQAQTSGSQGIEASGGPIDASPKAAIELNWEVDNPDKDELRYRVEYRSVGSEDWFDALEAGQVLTKDKLSWKTENVPEGRYRVRVTASDELSNPGARVTEHSAESAVVLVDNTAPKFSKISVKGHVIHGVVTDGLGPIGRLEVNLGGHQEWLPFEPTDGIFDEAKEEFSLDLSAQVTEGPTRVTLRVLDTAGNSEVSYVDLAGR